MQIYLLFPEYKSESLNKAALRKYSEDDSKPDMFPKVNVVLMVLFLGLPIGFMNTRIIPSFKLPNKLLAAHTGLWAPMLYNQL